MTSEASDLRLGTAANDARRSARVPRPAAPASAVDASSVTPRGWRARARWRLNTMWGAPMTDADLELTAEDIQAQLDYGRD